MSGCTGSSRSAKAIAYRQKSGELGLSNTSLVESNVLGFSSLAFLAAPAESLVLARLGTGVDGTDDALADDVDDGDGEDDEGDGAGDGCVLAKDSAKKTTQEVRLAWRDSLLLHRGGQQLVIIVRLRCSGGDRAWTCKPVLTEKLAEVADRCWNRSEAQNDRLKLGVELQEDGIVDQRRSHGSEAKMRGEETQTVGNAKIRRAKHCPSELSRGMTRDDGRMKPDDAG